MSKSEGIFPARLIFIGEDEMGDVKMTTVPPEPLYPESGDLKTDNPDPRRKSLPSNPDRRRSMPIQISQVDLKDLQEVGIDGVPQVLTSPNRVLRVFWIILIAIAFAITVYELYKTFHEYYNNPILTTYTVKAKLDGLRFPDVYVCPTNPLDDNKRRDLNMDPFWMTMLTVMQSKNAGNDTAANGLLKGRTSVWDHSNSITSGGAAFAPLPPPPPPPPPICDENGTCEFPTMEPTTTMGPPLPLPDATVRNVSEYFMTLGYELNDFIQACSFNTTVFENCSEIATSMLDGRHGKCFLVSMQSKNYWQVSPGLGLSLVLNIQTLKYPAENASLFEGVYVYIEDRFHPAASTKLLVHPGTYTSFNLRRQDFSLLRVESGDSKQLCIEKENQYPQFDVIKSQWYSLELCKMDCSQWNILQTCGCLLMMDTNFIKSELMDMNLMFCTPDQLSDCVFELMNNETLNKKIKDCHKKCLIPCLWTEYEVSTSAVRLNSEMILLDIAFDRMRVLSISQNESMSVDTLIGNVGGQISLFFGSSLLALAHAMVLCCFLIKRHVPNARTILTTGRVKNALKKRPQRQQTGVHDNQV